jgi:DNA repair protein RAD50
MVQWNMESGGLLQVINNRKKTEKTLKDDYHNVDRLFKEQLIKTKVS